MKTRIVAIAAAAVLAITLTGCGEDTTSTDATPQSLMQEEPSSEETATPLVAETAPNQRSDKDAEAAFLDEVRSRLAKIQTQIPNVTDEQLLAAAYEACQRLDSGESGENMSLIDGETTTGGYYMDSGAIIISARLTMCPIEN